jgi:hypothetical protein
MSPAKAEAVEVTPVPWSNLTSWDDGLDEAQKAVVAEAVESIATITSKTYKEMAAAFAKVKAALPDKNWIKWTNNAELNVGARTIQDLANANPWLESTPVEDKVLGRISARALCMIANCNKTKQKKCESLMVGGVVLTLKEVQEIVVGKKEEDPTPSAATRIKRLEEQLEASRGFTAAQVAAADAAMEERDQLRKEVDKLKGLLESALGSANVDGWLKETIRAAVGQGWTVDTQVMRKTSDKAMALFRDKEPATSKS